MSTSTNDYSFTTYAGRRTRLVRAGRLRPTTDVAAQVEDARRARLAQDQAEERYELTEQGKGAVAAAKREN